MAVDVMEWLRRYKKRLLVFVGVPTVGDLVKEALRGKAVDYIIAKLGRFGFWLIADPFALLTVAVVACLLWLVIVILRERLERQSSLIVDQHRQSFLRPRRSPSLSLVTAGVLIVIAALVVYGVSKYHRVVAHAADTTRPAPGAPTGLRIGLLYDNPLFIQEGKVLKLFHSVIPCVHERFAYGAQGIATMPGPGDKKPWLVIEPLRFQFVDWNGNGTVDLLFQVQVTNRGESSIVKSWELCLVAADQKVTRYHAKELSTTDSARLGGNVVSLNALMEPIEHGRAVTGWILFQLPHDVTKVESLTGSLQCRDYLDHPARFAFETQKN